MKHYGGYIEGGLGEEWTPETILDIDQLCMGLRVEMEHTNDPRIALEISIDHLMEFPDYYTRLAEMERVAGRRTSGVESLRPWYPGPACTPDIPQYTWVRVRFPFNIKDKPQYLLTMTRSEPYQDEHGQWWVDVREDHEGGETRSYPLDVCFVAEEFN